MPIDLAPKRRDFSDCTPHLALAVCLLYGQPSLFDQYRTRTNGLLDILIKSEPVDCPFQQEVNKMFPNIDNIRLYTSVSLKREAEYYVYLKREDGLWRLMSKRKSEVRKGQTPHTGVLFVADIAFNAPLHSNVEYTLTRMLTGGTAIQTFVGDMSDPEVMRQLSQCAITAWWFDELGKAPDFELPINVKPGRLVLGVHKDNIPQDYLVATWPLVPVRDRSYYDTRAKFQVIGAVPDHSLPVTQDFRCILPYIEGAKDWHEGERPVMGPRTEFTIAELLRHRIVPFLGYQVGAWVTVFGLGYDADRQDWAIQVFNQKRRAADIMYKIPIIVRNTHNKSIETNTVLTNCMAQALCGPAPNLERFNAVRRCLDKLLAGGSDLVAYHHWYARYGTRLNSVGELEPGGFTPEERLIVKGRLEQ